MSISLRGSKVVGLLPDERQDYIFVPDQCCHIGVPKHTSDLPPSPADSMQETTETVDLTMREESRLTRQIDRGAPGDAAIFSTNKTAERKDLAKRRSQYYEGVFAYREANDSARERVQKESIVIADVRTNVIIEDEYGFITDLSYNLSNRYQRPESSILVTLTHSACLFFAGSFDPAYILTIIALPSQLQPITNKRNAILLQNSLEKTINVDPSRGVVKFMPIPEENFAVNGKTVLGEIEDQERGMAEESMSRGLSMSESHATKKRQSMRSMKNLKTKISAEPMPISPRSEYFTPPLSDRATPPPITMERNFTGKKVEKAPTMGRRRSFIQGIFGRGR